jgi:hypothetical protein
MRILTLVTLGSILVGPISLASTENLNCFIVNENSVKCETSQVFEFIETIKDSRFYQLDYSVAQDRLDVFEEVIFSNEIDEVRDIDFNRFNLSDFELNNIRGILPTILNEKRKIQSMRSNFSKRELMKKRLLDNISKFSKNPSYQDDMLNRGRNVGVFSPDTFSRGEFQRRTSHLDVGRDLGINDPDSMRNGPVRRENDRLSVGREFGVKDPDSNNGSLTSRNRDRLEVGSSFGVNNPYDTSDADSLTRNNGIENNGKPDFVNEENQSGPFTGSRSDTFTNTGNRGYENETRSGDNEGRGNFNRSTYTNSGQVGERGEGGQAGGGSTPFNYGSINTGNHQASSERNSQSVSGQDAGRFDGNGNDVTTMNSGSSTNDPEKEPQANGNNSSNGGNGGITMHPKKDPIAISEEAKERNKKLAEELKKKKKLEEQEKDPNGGIIMHRKNDGYNGIRMHPKDPNRGIEIHR